MTVDAPAVCKNAAGAIEVEHLSNHSRDEAILEELDADPDRLQQLTSWHCIVYAYGDRSHSRAA